MDSFFFLTPDLGIGISAPDRFPHRPRPDLLPTLFHPISDMGELRWLPHYPDWLPRRSLHPARQPFLVRRFDAPAETVLLAWLPSYPDFARGGTPLPVGLLGGTESAAITTLELAPLGWLPQMPAWIAQRQLRVAARPAYSLPPVGLAVDVAKRLSWEARYPAWIAKALPRLPGIFVADPQFFNAPVPPLDATTLGWRPDYPAWVARAAPRLSGLIVTDTLNFPQPPAPVPVDALGWRTYAPPWVARLRGVQGLPGGLYTFTSTIWPVVYRPCVDLVGEALARPQLSAQALTRTAVIDEVLTRTDLITEALC